MKSSYENQNSRPDDPEWDFLGEYSLHEITMDIDPRYNFMNRMLFHSIQDLGLPLEWINNFEKAMIGCAKEAVAHFNQGRPESPVYLRLYCRKKTIESAKSAKFASQISPAQTTEAVPIFSLQDTYTNGGWGYFLVERGGEFQSSAAKTTCTWVDLYVYKEGD